MRLLVLIICMLRVSSFGIGAGISDITGPLNDIVFMGYANEEQIGNGIHLSLKSRAFVIEKDTRRLQHAIDAKYRHHSQAGLIGYVSIDGGMASDILKTKVIEKVNNVLGINLFTQDNLCISGTHTHSGPGGYLQYVIYQASTYGFVRESFQVLVDGITESLIYAYRNIEDAKIYINNGKLIHTNINRSPSSYLRNPIEERQIYESEGDTDKDMMLLKFVSRKDPKRIIGVLNWYAVHGTSMNNTNTLVSGDNKGYASYALELDLNQHIHNHISTNKQSVTAFASTNLGDVSPNTKGAKCIDTGLPCETNSSSCNNRCENCIAYGPGENMFESTKIIGRQQYLFAKQLMENATEEIFGDGEVDFVHSFVHMPTLTIDRDDRHHVNDNSFKDDKNKRWKSKDTLCSAAFGYSFADGPGMFDFTQGETSKNPFWKLVSSFLSRPTPQEIRCHHPKPILLNLGDMSKPYTWVPSVMPFQLLRIGNLFIIATSTELTTMAGRRLRKAVLNELIANKVLSSSPVPEEKIYVVIAGLANSYQSYTTTFEEYQAQRYEAASTLFGPNQLEGMTQEYVRLAKEISSSSSYKGHEHRNTMESDTNDDLESVNNKKINVRANPNQQMSQNVSQLQSQFFKSDTTYKSVNKRDDEPTPEDLLSKQWELAPKPLYDALPVCDEKTLTNNIAMTSYSNKDNNDITSKLSINNNKKMTSKSYSKSCTHYGDVVVDKNTKKFYFTNETVSVTFYGTNPRHALRNRIANNNDNSSSGNSTGNSYISIQQLFIEPSTGVYITIRQVADESDWSTKFIWKKAEPTHIFSKAVISHVSIEWDLFEAYQHEFKYRMKYQNNYNKNIIKYRICYNGLAKPNAKINIPFSGCSGEFFIVS